MTRLALVTVLSAGVATPRAATRHPFGFDRAHEPSRTDARFHFGFGVGTRDY